MSNEDGTKSKIREIGYGVMRAAAIDLAGRVLAYVVIALLALLMLLVLEGGSVPAWTLVAAVLIVGGSGIAARRGIAEDAADARARVRAVREELSRHNEYSRHLRNALDALQRVLSRDVDAEIPRYLDEAVLAPAQSILTEKPVENVRLSVLLPDDNDPERWTMRWSAGHSMIGKLKYNLPIADTLARHAFEGGEPQYWEDTENY